MPVDTTLKRERQRRNLQSRQVAEAIGVTEQYYCEIENGRTPSFRLALRIAQYFNKPLQELFSDHKINDSLTREPPTESRTA